MLVSLIKQPDYTLPALKDAIVRLLAPLGGIEHFVHRGDKVMLKLNLVSVMTGSTLAYTQAEVFQAVAELVLDCGGRVSCGDSPGAGTAAKIARLAGITPIAERLGVPVVEFTGTEVFDAKRVFKKLRLAKELVEADVVINLPRMKTHCQMLLTAAVKNLFGAVIGTEKFAWHYRAGRDYPTFARMLYEICMAVRPQLHIVDAVRAMHGGGPTAGIECWPGFLAAGSDPVAIDATLMRILGKAPEELYTIQAAAAAGDTAWQTAEIVGVSDLAELRPDRWLWPHSQTMAMIDPKIFRYLPFITPDTFRRAVAVYPAVNNEKCVQCGKCAQICSVKAITVAPRTVADTSDADGTSRTSEEVIGIPEGHRDSRQSPLEKVTIDQSKCIRCYCCHELCPQHALHLRGGWLAKIMQFFSRHL